MDSITQIVLGAAVGEAVLGKKVGYRAAMWGAVAGTVPDLDIIVNVFGSEMDAMIHHRGITHSIVFSLVFAPVMGWLIHRIYKDQQGSMKDWTRLAFWSLFTHPILDCFTTWGTQLFLPFSDYRVAFNSIFVADPVYTVPFLVCLLIALFLHRESSWRRFWNWAGIGLSSFYLILTLANKGTVYAHFGNALHAQGKSYERLKTYPTPLNNLLWYAVAESPSGFEIGYHSLLGDPSKIRYRFIPNKHQLIPPESENKTISRLKWFSKDLYALDTIGDKVMWNDLRFGLFNGWDGEKEPQFVFMYELQEEAGEFTGIHQKRPDLSGMKGEDWQLFWRKIWGDL